MEISKLYEIFLRCGSVTTDTRTLKGGELFFALKGENFDGNLFAGKAVEAGAAYAVVNAGSEFDGAGDRFIAVPDTLEALQDLARYHRTHVLHDGKPVPVIGLTGTNGKTTTKELIRTVLSSKYRVTATEGNLNNDIGVPLSLLKINSDTQIAVIEMGANHPDDIARLASVSRPDYGLITNVGKAHLLGFGSFEGVKKAKGQLYDFVATQGGTVFLNADDPDLSEMVSKRDGLSVVPYGAKFWNCILLPSDDAHPYLRLALPQDPGDPECETLLGLETKLIGSYNVPNVLAAIAVGLYFDVELEDAIAAIASYVPANSRSQLVKTQRNTLIVDAYNANPTSMAAAISNFKSVEASDKVALLGDMRELGEDSLKEHVAIVHALDGIGHVFLVGEEFRKALDQTGTPDNVKWYPTSSDLAEMLAQNPVSGCTILVKGSRGVKMENVIPAL